MFTKMIAVSFPDVCKAIHYARTLKSYSALCQLHLSETKMYLFKNEILKNENFKDINKI